MHGLIDKYVHAWMGRSYGMVLHGIARYCDARWSINQSVISFMYLFIYLLIYLLTYFIGLYTFLVKPMCLVLPEWCDREMFQVRP